MERLEKEFQDAIQKEIQKQTSKALASRLYQLQEANSQRLERLAKTVEKTMMTLKEIISEIRQLNKKLEILQKAFNIPKKRRKKKIKDGYIT